MDVKLLLNKAREGKPLLKSDVELIEKAYNFAKKAHESQKRKSGEQYFSHSYETALKIASWQLDSQTIAAALLHDVIEDTGATLEEIKKEFGEEVAFLVDGVTKLGRLKYHEENNGENISATASQKQLAA
ncbi:MAG: HD domain-containing protein, partial [Patescibacteria group bacterium]